MIMIYADFFLAEKVGLLPPYSLFANRHSLYFENDFH
jgi:hypothetical protein